MNFKPQTTPVIPARYRPKGLEILHEDRDILVVNKDAGLLTMSYRQDEGKTAEKILTQYLRKGNPRSKATAFVVHRLDRDTSGLLIFAKTPEMRDRLKNNWQTTEKLYLAGVHGHLKQKTGIFTSYLAEDEDQFVHSVDDPSEGRLSKTAYAVIKELKSLSLVKINLITGRKNQIRVHFADAGHPILGDHKYGHPGKTRNVMALHAKSLIFRHPFKGEPMSFETGIPPRILQLLPPPGLTEEEWEAAVVPKG